MSWDGWLPSIQGSMNPQPQAWIGDHNGSAWATTGLQLKAGEAQVIVKACNGDESAARGNGIWVGGQKYMYLRKNEDNQVLAKKKDLGFVTASATKSCLVIGVGAEGTQQGDLNKNVEAVIQGLQGAGM